jgi:hypothetical protein
MKGDGVLSCSGQDRDEVLLEGVRNGIHPFRPAHGEGSEKQRIRLLARGSYSSYSGSGLGAEDQGARDARSRHSRSSKLDYTGWTGRWRWRSPPGTGRMTHMSLSRLFLFWYQHAPRDPPVHAVVDGVRSVRALSNCRGLRRNAQHPQALGIRYI